LWEAGNAVSGLSASMQLPPFTRSDPLAPLIPDQSFVFLSRSSLSIGLPPLPRRLLPLPSIVQFFVLILLSLQSSRFIFSSSAYTPPSDPPANGSDRTITIVFLLMCLEGLCGGSAYVNTFFHVGREGEDGGEGEEGARRKMEKEFRIGAVGAADSCGESLDCAQPACYVVVKTPSRRFVSVTALI